MFVSRGFDGANTTVSIPKSTNIAKHRVCKWMMEYSNMVVKFLHRRLCVESKPFNISNKYPLIGSGYLFDAFYKLLKRKVTLQKFCVKYK